MNREEVYQEIKGMFGLVPTFMTKVPDNTLELEWNLFKKVVVEETAIPNKYKELIGLGISAVSKCQYCLFFHTQLAILFGATPEEIEEAVHYAKNTAGWSAYINGLQIDMEQFKQEISNMCAFVNEAHAAEHA
ncbi:carboxymuconolactone decarboxylase family protein [Marinilabiliaceae bacterium JC017]|nr:carboxymuconolactone decarboxylase family protein [Marinilabiliaceae bacterium JC017]